MSVWATPHQLLLNLRERTEEALGEANTREQASSKKAVAEGLRRVCQARHCHVDQPPWVIFG